MFSSLPLPILLAVFVIGASAVWIAGIQLSNTTDSLSKRFGFGEALGGLIFLAITTNLPEIAITTTAALTNNLGIAIGNILGGIAIQTVVLSFLDLVGLGRKDSLTYRAASLVLVLEGILVTSVLIIAIMGTQLPSKVIFLRITPGSVFIAVVWLVGIWLIKRARTHLPWQDKGRAPDRDKDLEEITKNDKGKGKAPEQDAHTFRTIVVFFISSAVTLVAGAALEMSGDAIAKDIGLSGVLFGATILAAATALPEVSTGLQSIKIRDYELAVSDIFGGNAFLPVLFLLADLLSGKAVLSEAKNTDIYLACLGILVTTVYLYGLIFRPRKQVLAMGVDSFIVLVVYALGIAGLIAIALSSGKM